MRVVGVVGLPYCGSTTFSRLMAGVPGVASVGEPYWLVKRFADFETRAACSVHGDGCQVFTPEVKRAAGYSAENIYDRMVELFPQFDTLLVADKYPEIYDSVEWSSGRTLSGAVLLWKHPVGHALSSHEHDGAPLVEAARVWARSYRSMLGWCLARTPLVPFVVVRHEHVSMRPYSEVCRVVRALGLPSLPEPRAWAERGFDPPVGWHHLYGNPRAVASDRLVLDDRWRTKVGLADAAVIMSDELVRATYAELESRDGSATVLP